MLQEANMETVRRSEKQEHYELMYLEDVSNTIVGIYNQSAQAILGPQNLEEP